MKSFGLLQFRVLQPIPDLVVLGCKQGFKPGPLSVFQLLRLPGQEAFQQDVELFHAPAAKPSEMPEACALLHFSGD